MTAVYTLPYGALAFLCELFQLAPQLRRLSLSGGISLT